MGKTIPSRLAQRAKEKGMNMKQLSEASGIPLNRLQNIARGKIYLKRSEVAPLYIALEGIESWRALGKDA